MKAYYTRTQTAILSVLSDGMPHTQAELRKCLNDEMSTKGLALHISMLRKRLLPLGQTIVCEYSYQKFLYRHVRLLAPYSRE